MSTEETRYCMMDQQLDGFEITLQTEQEVLAIGDFKIYVPETKEILDSFKLAAEWGRKVKKRLSLNQLTLNKNIMTWNIVCCSKDPNLYSAKVTVEILQQSRPCKLTIPITYKLIDIPLCDYNDSAQMKGSAVFILKNQVELPM